MGLDPRESTPGFKRQIVILSGEVRSFKRVSIVMSRVLGSQVSANTAERICLDVGEELSQAEQDGWQAVLTGEITVPQLAIVEFDGGRIRTRQEGKGPGVHLAGQGWNETKNAILVSADSDTSETDPEPHPPPCFLDKAHVFELAEQAKTTEKQAARDDLPEETESADREPTAKQSRRGQAPHRPRPILRTVVSSMKNSTQFGEQMSREAHRRRFDEAARKAYVADGLACNWTIHQQHFRDYTPILDFVHAVTYLFTASLACFGKTGQGWLFYCDSMRSAWQGKIDEVIEALRGQQQRIGLPEADSGDDDPREQLRRVIGYLENNRGRMRYDEYRRQGLPTTSAWMESAVKEINYRTKGTEMFWNNPTGAEAILQIRSAALSDDDRLVRLLIHRPGQAKLRRSHPKLAT